MRSLQPLDILLIHWRVYNSIANTSKWVLFLLPSDVYVGSFLYLLYSSIKLYYTKALSDQASSLAPDWILLFRRPRILASLCSSGTTFQEGDDRGWNGWIASLTQWRWIWVNSRSWWWKGKCRVLQSMGSQRVGHDWVTELNWTTVSKYSQWRLQIFYRIYDGGWKSSYIDVKWQETQHDTWVTGSKDCIFITWNKCFRSTNLKMLSFGNNLGQKRWFESMT